MNAEAKVESQDGELERQVIKAEEGFTATVIQHQQR